MTNAKKAKQQRAQGTRKPAQRKSAGGATGLWIGIGVVAVVLVVAAVLLSGGGDSSGGDGGQPSPDGSVTIAANTGQLLQAGEAIPEFSAPALTGGGTVSWKDYVGKPTILAVWAPWCPHCQAELPRLSAAVAGRPNIQLVTVATSLTPGEPPSPLQYMTDNGLSFPVAVDDANTTIMKGLGVTSFPTTYYVDSSGNVVQSTSGEVDAAQLEQILSALQ